MQSIWVMSAFRILRITRISRIQVKRVSGHGVIAIEAVPLPESALRRNRSKFMCSVLWVLTNITVAHVKHCSVVELQLAALQQFRLLIQICVAAMTFKKVIMGQQGY